MSLIDQIIGVESGGNPNASNPNSSAVGAGQFIAPTWISVVKQHFPDLAQGKSDADILAMRNDPNISRQATAAYAADNQAILQKNGLPVTPGTTYLAHFAGPGGAVKVLQADPNAAVEDVLGPGVIKANPFLKGMTAQGLQAWAARKMGTTLPQPGAQNAQTASASPPSGMPVLQQQAPILPPQAAPQAAPQANPNLFAQLAPQPQAPPIYYAPRRPIDLSALRAAISRPPIFSQG
jgi:hypothetical protein